MSLDCGRNQPESNKLEFRAHSTRVSQTRVPGGIFKCPKIQLSQRHNGMHASNSSFLNSSTIQNSSLRNSSTRKVVDCYLVLKQCQIATNFAKMWYLAIFTEVILYLMLIFQTYIIARKFSFTLRGTKTCQGPPVLVKESSAIKCIHLLDLRDKKRKSTPN